MLKPEASEPEDYFSRIRAVESSTNKTFYYSCYMKIQNCVAEICRKRFSLT